MDNRKSIEASIKRAESTAKTFREKGDRLYARYKNFGSTSFPEHMSKEDLYLEAQQCYDRARKSQEAADSLRSQL